VYACNFTPDGSGMISASGDKTLILWAVETGAVVRMLKGHTDAVKACTFSSDGRHILSASWDQTLKLWDAATGACLTTFHADGRLNGCAFAADGVHVAAAGARGVYMLRVVG
jgi:WD40 repeat protein